MAYDQDFGGKDQQDYRNSGDFSDPNYYNGVADSVTNNYTPPGVNTGQGYAPNSGADPNNPYGWNGTSYANPPAGYHWDSNLANFVPDAPPPPPTQTASAPPPAPPPAPQQTAGPPPAPPAPPPVPYISPQTNPVLQTQDYTPQLTQTGQAGGILPNNEQLKKVQDALFSILLGKAQQGLNIDPNTDPTIKPQVDAAMATQLRARRNYLNDLAESSNPFSSGTRATAATQTAEKAGQNVSALQSQLVAQELTARRTEIQNALQSLGGLLSSDQQLQLQRQLDSVNAALNQQQLNNNLGLGMLGLGIQQQQVGNQNAQFYASLAQQAQALGLNQDEFLARLGLDATNIGNYWDALNSGRL